MDAALAVVEDVRGLVDDEVGEGVLLGEVLGRDEAGCLLAQPDEAGRGLSEQLFAETRQVQVRERPRRTVEALLEQERLDVRARERGEHDFLLGAREQAAHHRLDLPTREHDWVADGKRVVGPSLSEPLHLANERTTQVVVGPVRTGGSGRAAGTAPRRRRGRLRQLPGFAKCPWAAAH